MHLVSEFMVLFTYFGLGIIVVSLLVGHLIDRRVLQKRKQRDPDDHNRT